MLCKCAAEEDVAGFAPGSSVVTPPKEAGEDESVAAETDAGEEAPKGAEVEAVVAEPVEEVVGK